MKPKDVLIIGAGAAGLLCAIEAGRRKRSVVVIDHSTKVGRKISISGGGRCNFTNLNTTPAHFVSQNPHFCKSALSRFTPNDFVQLVEKHRIPYHEKSAGQLFCDGPAQNIVKMLLQECEDVGVEVALDTAISSVQKKENFEVQTSKEAYQATSLVIATGGLSIPPVGATDFGYRVAEQFGHSTVDPSPALDGFVFSKREADAFQSLAGVSLRTQMTCNDHSFCDELLFTHLGLSGPVALQSSLYWNRGDPVRVDFLPEPPDGSLSAWLLAKKREGSRSEVKSLLSQFLPKRFIETFSSIYLEKQGGLLELSDKGIEAFCQRLHAWSFVPKSTVGYRKAEVTRGGVDTSQISSKTMESSKISGLYFVGEVLDVTGQLGGYNFQWAWSSGWAAGQVV